jgi:DNA-binding NarL/FixJ family response regulator
MIEHALPKPAIRVVLVALAGLLRDIVRQRLELEPDIALVGEVRDSRFLQGVLVNTWADVVLCTVTGRNAIDAYPALFADHPKLKLVTVTDDGRGYLCEPLGDVSPQSLVETIRRAAMR